MRYGVMGSVLAAATAALALVAAQAVSGAAAPARWIVFSAHPDSEGATQTAQLLRVPATGGTPEQITKGRLIATQPSFSPDGKTVVFQRLGSGLFRMNLDGSDLKRLTARGRHAYPVFSSDRKKTASIPLTGTAWRRPDMSPTRPPGPH